MIASAFFPALLALLPATLASPVPQVKTTGTTKVKQVISQDFADPSLFQDYNDWWAFSTNNHKTLGKPNAIGSQSLINVQVAHSTDNLNSWTVTGQDALPTVGAWVHAQGAAVWAPNVVKNAQGQYVLHYSAAYGGDPSKHCVGAAVASKPQGPYTPQPQPIACNLAVGGAIDSSAFHDADGSYWLVYKVDGNSIGHGGSCGNTVQPIVPTPIMLQRLQSDGYTPVGAPTQLLDRSDGDGPLIEAPSLARTSDGKYVLFFSSNCFATDNYDVSYAFADKITGPYVKRGPMMVTGTDGLYSPGGAHVAHDGVHMVFHAGDVGPQNLGYRAMYQTTISIDTSRQVVSSTV
ncbi:hypothetical protein H2203_000606 [Taxawa tesnikishii (nom. ined.)]|nr:hypothetical protein H2203_000606 [Dothideales sp. JES 119]